MSGFYKTRKKGRRIMLIALAFFLYLALTNIVIRIHTIDTDMMRPALRKGERILTVSFRIPKLFSPHLVRSDVFVKRGDIVVVDFDDDHSFTKNFASAVLRFFTAGRYEPGEKNHRLFVKRVIALPGDEITITNYAARVKPRGSVYTYTEYECSDKFYNNTFPENNALWDEGVPFSGNLDSITLGEDEYFVLSDDRSSTNDSRTWGAVPFSNIACKAVFRYWPFVRFDKL